MALLPVQVLMYWRQDGLSRGLESELIQTNEDQQYNLHEPDQPITDQNFRGLPASILVI